MNERKKFYCLFVVTGTVSVSGFMFILFEILFLFKKKCNKISTYSSLASLSRNPLANGLLDIFN